ncbi:Protein PTCD3-like protein, mitochondrial [Armadillidium nasatum]|uniref:Protein PTCD3-like protein, mitochondrial n=1 Tax=Armadillidium nasatum TaxID=96803 RepID=A0A5N5TCM0_9CRUS|nr:Protein PTCD3-like protein, mitochondrial [Armadillidium nasatum]
MNKSGYIIFGKRINLYQIFNRNCQSQGIEAATRNFPKPVIPVRIKRGPTDILKALATTVGRDLTAPAYKFHDDPYLYPFSQGEKRQFALSKESGRKAAQWIRDKYPHIFNHNPDDPVIKDFIPKITFNEDSDVSEADLLRLINNAQVTDSINVYKACQSKNVELSDDVRQSLLELVSFYNCDDALDTEWIEEKKDEPKERYDKVKTWKEGSFAEELFNELKENGEKPYCAIIRGMCKYFQKEKAWQLYQEALDKNLEILGKMIELKQPPNVGTLNALLEALVHFRGWNKAETLSLQILKEFKNLNVEPCLATYFYLLKIAYKSRNRKSGLLPSILDLIENKTFDIRDIKDTKFFYTAMEICFKDLRCYQTATRVHNFLACGNNFKFIGGNQDEYEYLRFYFVMSMNSLPLEDFMKLYDDWVPHLFSPRASVMMELINTISLYGRLELLPRIWSDCILLEQSKHEEILTLTLDVINRHDLENFNEELVKQLVNIVWYIWKNPGYQRGKDTFDWTGSMIGDCLSILVRCKEVEKSSIVFNYAVEEKPYAIIGMIAKYCKENDYDEAAQWAKDLCNKTSTPENVKSKLLSVFSLKL